MLSAVRLHARMRIIGLLMRRDDALNASLTWKRHVSAMHWLVRVWGEATQPTEPGEIAEQIFHDLTPVPSRSSSTPWGRRDAGDQDGTRGCFGAMPTRSRDRTGRNAAPSRLNQSS